MKRDKALENHVDFTCPEGSQEDLGKWHLSMILKVEKNWSYNHSMRQGCNLTTLIQSPNFA